VNPVAGQDGSKALVSFHNGKVYPGMNNYFRVVVQQVEAVKLNQLNAYFLPKGKETQPERIQIKYEQSRPPFSVNPPSIGQLVFEVKLEDEAKEVYKFTVHPITAVIMFGGNRHQGSPTNPNVFRSQRGLYAVIEDLDIDARCTVVDYEVIRVAKSGHTHIVTNEGDVFQSETRKLIDLAQPGDRYIFTKTRYRCPGSPEVHYGRTLSFELR
jgi:hypothetical protein